MSFNSYTYLKVNQLLTQSRRLTSRRKVDEKFCEVYATFKYYNPVYFDVHLSFVC